MLVNKASQKRIVFGIPNATAVGVRRFLILILFWLEVIFGAAAAMPSETCLPFDFSQGLLWIKIQVPQSDRPLNFLFDTGAGVSVINADTAAVLGLQGGSKISVRGVDTTATGRWPVKLKATADKLTLPSQYLSLDLSQLALSCGRPLDGLLGADFIHGHVVEIDFESHQLRFLKRVRPATTDTVLPLKICHDCFCVPVAVNEERHQWMRLDTGCATALQWVTGNSQPSTDTKTPAIGLTGTIIPQTKTTVSIGKHQFVDVPTGIHHRPIFSDEAGLLGNGLLSRFKTVTIDTKSACIVLSPR